MVLKDVEAMLDSLAQHFEQSVSYASSVMSDVSEADFKVMIPMPGVGDADVTVEYSGRVVTVKGTSSVQGFSKSYKQKLVVPSNYELDSAQASLKNGLFVLTVPKKQESVKTIKVQTDPVQNPDEN